MLGGRGRYYGASDWVASSGFIDDESVNSSIFEGREHFGGARALLRSESRGEGVLGGEGGVTERAKGYELGVHREACPRGPGRLGGARASE